MNDLGAVAQSLAQLEVNDGAYWDYRQQSYRYGLHGLLRYPAMMVPQMQGDLLDVMLQADPSIQHVIDPFVGVGTTLVESLGRDVDFTGFDVNPLAILVCQAKSGVLNGAHYGSRVKLVLQRIEKDTSRAIDVTFPERDKWFSLDASRQLSRIRRAIIREPERWVRRLLWVALAETIRSVSNSRTSTYKLHLRPDTEQDALPNASSLFPSIALESAARVSYHESYLNDRGLLEKHRPARRVELRCGQTQKVAFDPVQGADLLITSPPYGDNRSTVPYGQFSYLQLRWIPAEDLPAAPDAYLNAYRVDADSLGGTRKGAERHVGFLQSVSFSYGRYSAALAKQRRPDLDAKVSSFLYDYYRTLTAAMRLLRDGGHAVLTLGDRSVGGLTLPFTSITTEMLSTMGMSEVVLLRRQIPQKLTPTRNSVGKTMGTECVLVMRKGVRDAERPEVGGPVVWQNETEESLINT